MPRIIELVKTRIPARFGLDPIRDIQVLCPMNRGGVGARSLNIELQKALNPAGERKVERFGWTFAPGDKVMQIENDYDKEVYNGDIGYGDEGLGRLSIPVPLDPTLMLHGNAGFFGCASFVRCRGSCDLQSPIVQSSSEKNKVVRERPR